MLIDILISHHYLTEQQKEQLQVQSESSALSELIQSGIFSSQELARILSTIFNEPVQSVHEFEFDIPELHQFRHLVLKHQVLPLKIEGNMLYLAMSDLSLSEPQDDFRFASQKRIQAVLVDHAQLTGAIRKLYGESISSTAKNDQSVASNELEELASIDAILDDGDVAANEAPISRFIYQILTDAVRKRASDIHFEPFEKNYQIRFRLDGMLQPQMSPPFGLARRIATRIKILAKLNIAERRLPQDGRIKLALSEQLKVDMRVSIMPTYWGEKIVLRLLSGNTVPLDIHTLGYNEKQKTDYLNALHKPQGMILITGPTGSGKTVSLYTGLNIINTPERNISTAEDPIEICLDNINQVNINPKIGFTFTTALHALLRQDPDVVMVGEIRDTETAEIAIKAAQTGHLVLSTLHTNSAAESIVRLVNMGIAPYNIASSLSIIIAQRLARRLCPQCKVPHPSDDYKLTAMQRAYPKVSLDGVYMASAKGCDHCNNGFSGRVGVYEVMPVNSALIQAIDHNASATELEKIAVANGMLTLQESGIEKMNQGLTSLEELQRVISFNMEQE